MPNGLTKGSAKGFAQGFAQRCAKDVRSVLVVDGRDSVVEPLRVRFAASGWHVGVTADGELAAHDAPFFDVVIVDLGRCLYDGWFTVARILGLAAVLAIGPPGARARARRLGVDGYVAETPTLAGPRFADAVFDAAIGAVDAFDAVA